MVSFCDYEIHLLFLLLVKFHGSGKFEIYSPGQKVYQCFFFYHGSFWALKPKTPTLYFWTWCSSKWFPNSKVAFNSFCISKLRYDAGISISRQIKSDWLRYDRNQEQRILCFKCNNTIRSEFNINIETEKCTIFLISVSRFRSHEKSYCFVRWLSITNMMAI